MNFLFQIDTSSVPILIGRLRSPEYRKFKRPSRAVCAVASSLRGSQRRRKRRFGRRWAVITERLSVLGESVGVRQRRS